MTTLAFKVSGIMIAAGLFAATNAAASPAEDDLVNAKVPFAFIVGDVRLPAGTYTVKELIDGGGVIELTSADGHRVALTTTIAASESEAAQPQLVFKKFENEYFLSRVAPVMGTEREVVLTPATMEHEITVAKRMEPLPATGDEVR